MLAGTFYICQFIKGNRVEALRSALDNGQPDQRFRPRLDPRHICIHKLYQDGRDYVPTDKSRAAGLPNFLSRSWVATDGAERQRASAA